VRVRALPQTPRRKPQHSTAALKETERRCHRGYLGSKVLTYGEGCSRRTEAGRWPCQLSVCILTEDLKHVGL